MVFCAIDISDKGLNHYFVGYQVVISCQAEFLHWTAVVGVVQPEVDDS